MPKNDDTIECPYCRASIYEDAVQCPRCGNYLSAEDSPPARKPWWIIIGILVCLAIALLWAFGR